MTPVLTFFNNKGGVGKTSLVYHAAWMLSELDHTVLVVDLDPQANLTAAFLDEDTLAGIWSDRASSTGHTIHQCVAPLAQVGDVKDPRAAAALGRAVPAARRFGSVRFRGSTVDGMAELPGKHEPVPARFA